MSPLKSGRAFAAALRAKVARNALSHCNLCAHDCGVNRLEGERGLCHADGTARVFSGQVEVSDELELIPTYAIALSGCDLRCSFCITGRESWNANAGAVLNAEKVADRALAALESGSKTVMILGGEPTVHLPAALEIVSHLPDHARLVWKTNAHGSAAARVLLDGMFDVWLADYKFGNDDCARKLAGVSHYTSLVRENLVWANERSELIVRHLVMPGHVECCWEPVAVWMAENLPGVKVNLRTGFWPAWQARKHPELRGTTGTEESRRALAIAREHQLNLIQ